MAICKLSPALGSELMPLSIWRMYDTHTEELLQNNLKRLTSLVQS